MNMLPPLKPGALVRIISPSATYQKQVEAEDLLKKGVHELEALGLRVEYGEYAHGKYYYKSGTLQDRLADIHAAFSDPNVSVIMTTQGGHNSNELLPHLSWEIITRNPKYFFGSSDITVLLNSISTKTKLVTYHGVDVLWGLGKNGAAFIHNQLQRVLFEGQFDYKKHPDYPARKIIRQGTGEGVCLGGCLPSFCLLLGTRYDPLVLLNQPFVFIMESIGQSIAELESMIVQLTQQLNFKKYCRGIIVGYFFLCSEENKEDNRDIATIVSEHTQDMSIPIIEIRELGHAVENIIFPIGKTIRINANNEVNITIPSL